MPPAGKTLTVSEPSRRLACMGNPDPGYENEYDAPGTHGVPRTRPGIPTW